MSKKELIKTIALQLFNQHGLQNVSTNHIAEKANISPGNLYYHYKNKEEIIREIYEDMICFMDQVWVEIQEDQMEIINRTMLFKLSELQKRFEFFYQDISSILRNDPILKERYIENRKKRLIEMDTMFQSLKSLKLINLPKSKEQRASLYEHLWFITEFSILQKDFTTQEQRNFDYTYQLIEPLLTKKGKSLFQQLKMEI
jgi:AcrR family transcriptional regulator